MFNKTDDDNSAADGLGPIQNLFQKFANMTRDIQEKMHNRIDYLEDLHENVPRLCEHKRMIDGIVSVVQSVELMIPRVVDTIERRNGQIKRTQKSTYGLLPIIEIPDYSDQIRDLSKQIMDGIKANAVESMNKMGFIVTDLLGKQVFYSYI